MNDTRRIVIAQLTDTHIRVPGRLAYRQVDTASHLQAAVELLAAPPVPIDAIIHTGDLTDFGQDEEYRYFCELIAPLSTPFYPIPGNHDERHAFRRAFADRLSLPADGPLSYVAELRGLRLMMLDSTVPGESHGEMSATTLAWMDRQLASAPEAPTIVTLHHPPFESGIAHMDAQNCRGGNPFAEVLTRHPQVLATLCGHVHRTVVTTFGNRVAAIGPSPAHAVSFDLSPDGPLAFSMEPPAVLLHVWDGDQPTRLVTHWLPVGGALDRYPFFDAQGKLID